MDIRRKLKRRDYEVQPYLAWNAFVSLLATEKYENLTPLQADATLIFWYDSEVQNGGHLQYFENKGVAKASGAVAALSRRGAAEQSRTLADAIAVWSSRPRPRIETAQEFCQAALKGEFDSFDRAYHACKPAVMDLLEEILKNNFSEFIELE